MIGSSKQSKREILTLTGFKEGNFLSST